MIYPYEVQEPISHLTRFNFGTLAMMMISWIVFVPAVIVVALNLVRARHRLKGLLLPLFGILLVVTLIALGLILLFLAYDGAGLLAQAPRSENEFFPEPEIVLARTTYHAIPNHVIIIFTLAVLNLLSSLWRLVVHVQVKTKRKVSQSLSPKTPNLTKTPNL